MLADRHREAGQAEQRRHQGGADAVQHARLALGRGVEPLLRRQVGQRRHHHQRRRLEEGHPALQQRVAVGQRAQEAGQVARRPVLHPEPHGGAAVIIAVLLHLRQQRGEELGRADGVPELDRLRDVGRQRLLHRIAGGGQVPAGLPHRLRLGGVGEAAGHLRHQRDADRPRRRGPHERHIGPARVAPAIAGHHRQRQAQVAHAPRQRALGGHQLRPDRAADHALRAVAADAAIARAQPDHAAAIGRDAHGSADVVAMRDGPDAGGDRGAGAARGAARRDRRVARVQRAAVQRVVGHQPHGEGRRVGAPDEDGAGGAQVGRHRAVLGGDLVGEGDDAVGGGMAALVDVDLDGHRHAVQRAERLAPCPRRVGGIGGGQRLGVHALHHGVERRVHLLEPREAGLGRLPRRGAAEANQPCELRRIELPEFRRHAAPPPAGGASTAQGRAPRQGPGRAAAPPAMLAARGGTPP